MQCILNFPHRRKSEIDMFYVYEMRYDKDEVRASRIECVPFTGKVFEQNQDIYKYEYNGAFYPMRVALDVKPYEWFSDSGAKLVMKPDVFVLIENNELVGSVGCYGNEVDDLFVCSPYLKKGYGRKLLVWAMNHIRQQGYHEIVLHVAEWNAAAVKLYTDEGFEIVSKELVEP